MSRKLEDFFALGLSEYVHLLHEIEGYSERQFQQSGRTAFPNVRKVAQRLGVPQSWIKRAAEEHPNLSLTYYHVSQPPPIGDYFVETLTPPA